MQVRYTLAHLVNQPRYYHALLHHVSLTCHMWKNADIPTPCQLNLVVQSNITPGEFDMWQNADVPRSDVHCQAN